MFRPTESNRMKSYSCRPSVRKSLKLCSHHCAVLATSRRFRAGQANARRVPARRSLGV